MKTQVMSRAAYEQTYGPLSSRGITPEKLDLWEKIKKLGVAEVLIIDPEKGDNIDHLKSRVYATILSLSKKLNPTFRCVCYKNADEKQVVVVKLPKSGSG